MADKTTPAERYFEAMRAALDGLDIFLRDTNSPLYKHDLVGVIVTEYLARLKNSFACWQNRLAFTDTFKISRAESGFPVFQNVLELEKDQTGAKDRLASIPSADQLRSDMTDFILRRK